MATLKGIQYFREVIEGINSGDSKKEIDVSREVEAYIAQQAAFLPGVKFCRSWAQISSGVKTRVKTLALFAENVYTTIKDLF